MSIAYYTYNEPTNIFIFDIKMLNDVIFKLDNRRCFSKRLLAEPGAFFLYSTIIRIGYDFVYGHIVSPLYSYTGLISNGSFSWGCISWIVLAMIALCVYPMYKDQGSHISDSILLLIYVLSAIPFTSMVQFGVFTENYTIANTVYYVVLFSLGVNIRLIKCRQSKKFHFSIPRRWLLVLFAITASAVIIYISAKYSHFRLNFSLNNVYELRTEAREYHMPGILNYMLPWSRALLPIIAAIFFYKKHRASGVICLAIQFISFGVDGAKVSLFILLFVIGIQFFPKSFFDNMHKWALKGISGMLFVGIFEYLLLGSFYVSSTFFRRLSFLTNLISSQYFDFFTNNTPDYFRSSFLRYFGYTSPYATESIPRMIGRIYYNRPAMNCNNGLISDAITNFGLCGILFMPILIAVVLMVLNFCAEEFSKPIKLTISVYSTISLTNSFLFTAMLTGGILLIILLLIFVDDVDTGRRIRLSRHVADKTVSV